MESSDPQTQTRDDDDGQPIVFDTSSGISLEEQKEILDSINAMAQGSHLAGEAPVIKARKNGVLFPIFVNICALAVLGLGFFLLFFLHGRDEQNIETGSAVLGITERKLIQEIRLETGRQLSEKDEEINDILAKLSSADAEYLVLQESVDSLTEEQKERAAYLLSMQDEYHSTLSGLEEEKSRILENSRQRESALRIQAEERAGALSMQIEQSQANLDSAMEELKALNSEKERSSLAEGQMSGFYASLGNQLRSGSLDEAQGTLEAAKTFLAAASRRNYFQDAGKQAHLAAIAAMESALADARNREYGSGETAAVSGTVFNQSSAQSAEEAAAFDDLKAKFDALEAETALLGKKAADQERALTLMSSQGSDQAKMISDYLGEIDALRTANSNQQLTLNRRDSEIAGLRAESDENSRQTTILNNSISALRSDLSAANSRADNSDATLAMQKNDYDVLLEQKNALQSQYDDLQRRVEAALRVVIDE